SLAGLSKRLRRAERPQSGREILQRLLTEICIGIAGEERSINLPLLEICKNLFRLLEFCRRRRIICREQQRSNPAGYRPRGAGPVLGRQHHNCSTIVGENNVLCREARNLSTM